MLSALRCSVAGWTGLWLTPAFACGVAGIAASWRQESGIACILWSVALVLGGIALLAGRARMRASLVRLGEDLDRLARGEDVMLDLDRQDEMQDLVLAIASLQTHLKAATLDLAESHGKAVTKFDQRIGPALHELDGVVH